MPPALFIPLITEVGIPLATKLLAIYENNTTVTSEMWASLLKESSYTSKDRLIEVLKSSGIDPTSDQGKKFLDLIPTI